MRRSSPEGRNTADNWSPTNRTVIYFCRTLRTKTQVSAVHDENGGSVVHANTAEVAARSIRLFCSLKLCKEVPALLPSLPIVIVTLQHVLDTVEGVHAEAGPEQEGEDARELRPAPEIVS